VVVGPLELCRLDLGRFNVGRLALRYRVLLLPRLGMGCFSASLAVSPRAVSPLPVSFSSSHSCNRPPLGHEDDRRAVDGNAARGLSARGPYRSGLGVCGMCRELRGTRRDDTDADRRRRELYGDRQ